MDYHSNGLSIILRSLPERFGYNPGPGITLWEMLNVFKVERAKFSSEGPSTSVGYSRTAVGLLQVEIFR